MREQRSPPCTPRAQPVDLAAVERYERRADGSHVASCGGAWMALVNGFAGLRDIEGHDLRFAPRLPVDWESMSFRVIARGSRLEVEMTADATTYRLLDGQPMSLISDGEHFTVSRDSAVAMAAVRDTAPVAAAPGLRLVGE